jgi:hypothetical protein
MTSSQLILISVASAVVAVFTMLVVAVWLKSRSRRKDDSDQT